MKTKQAKEELERSIDDDNAPELSTKTRSRKKAADASEEQKVSQDDSKTSKEPTAKKNLVTRPSKTIGKKRPLGIRKTLRNKKVVVAKEKLKNVLKQGAKRGRKPAIKVEPVEEVTAADKETAPLISPSEIKTEPLEETSPSSRSSSPKTAAKRQRLSSDMHMMKSVLGDAPSLVLGPRTSPYSMRSERSNSPSLTEGKSLRSGKPRKLKNNLLNEVVKNEQKKRRLISDSKVELADGIEDGKKRGRSYSRDGSEISKCSDITESDISLSETIIDTECKVDNNKELTKKVDKSKTDLDIDIESNIQISTDKAVNDKVPSLNVDSKLENDMEPSSIIDKTKNKMSLQRSTSLDSDNNNSRNRLKLDVHNSSDVEVKSKSKKKTEKDTLFNTRSSILTSMSKTFNSKEVNQNIRKARRGRKRAQASQTQAKNGPSNTSTVEAIESVPETLDSLSKEIKDLISTLEDDKSQSDDFPFTDNISTEEAITQNATPEMQTKSVSKFYGLSEVKPLSDNNTNATVQDTPTKDKDWSISNANTPSKNDDSENIRLHFDEDEDSDKPQESTKESDIAYKCAPVASIDKLMDRLKVFEEFDKRRQTELMKTDDNNTVMVTNDVVLIPKSGADIKPLKDIQTVRSPEKPIEKENVLSCFENNSAISIVKRDHVRKSLDVELTNSVTLIKRNSVNSRKESTGSNHSRESTDAITIFEKSLGKDVTLTEIRKSVDKSAPSTPVEIHQLATLHANTPSSPNIIGVMIDSNQISITPRSSNDPIKQLINTDIQITKKTNKDSTSRKSLESTTEAEDKMATIEKIKSPPPVNNHQIKSPSLIVAIKSPEAQPMDTEALAPPLESVKTIPENISMTSETPKVQEMDMPETSVTKLPVNNETKTVDPIVETKVEKEQAAKETKSAIDTKVSDKADVPSNAKEAKPQEAETKVKGQSKVKTPRASLDSLPGPSNVLLETPESQKRKETVLRTLGLLTHKAANEAKIEKQKEKERMYAKTYGPGGVNKNKAAKSGDYTGTLKTIIKLNRSSGERDKKKYRSSLKMTFQKSKNRTGKPAMDLGEAAEDDTFYTIERREGVAGGVAEGGHRKSYSNRINHDIHAQSSVVEQSVEPIKDATTHLVIPEKASSFSIHPGRLCMDQCCYCGGKFGLFDTPCHIAQMKSTERQKKVLDNEEKLTIDSCLCDACYRHVDRRANCPSYRKRPLAKLADGDLAPAPDAALSVPEKSITPPTEDESEEERAAGAGAGAAAAAAGRSASCHAEGCGAVAEHSIRRKWLIKMRSSVNRVLKLQLDYPGLHTLPLCARHHAALAPLLACALCRRRLTKHHNVHLLNHGYLEINSQLEKEGIPVQFTERPVLCKLCRYYCTLLQRPGFNDRHAKNYRIRLLQEYNIEVPPDAEYNGEDTKQMEHDISINIKKKKNKIKSKQRKSSDLGKSGDDSVPEPADHQQEDADRMMKEESNDSSKTPQNMEEDIESLISSNKILVPSKPSSSGDTSMPSDASDQEAAMDFEGPLIALDKQTELQYLLQKQNNPAQFLHKPVPNLTQKHKNILKAQNVGIQKPGQQHRISDKNTKKLQKLGQIIIQKEKTGKGPEETEMIDVEKMKECGVTILKNISLNDECTIETIPNKRPADINILKNKWQMSGSFTQVKRNLSELSKKLTTDKDTRRSEPKYSNPVKRLETNPSISVRELFPGEEEMNLQCNIEFNNVKGVTPEGWEKCNTTIQYDVETKKLWSELQRPYGNQSSFLRHLVLLEKYFRNGDLVLAQNATSHAANYSDSVQSRLRAYDNVASDAPRRSEPAISLIEFRKKPAVNGKSLLKTNQSEAGAKSPEMKKPLPPPFPKPKAGKSESKKTKPMPPELIAINTPNAQGRKAIQNVLHNIQQLVKGVSASDPTEIAAAPLPAPKVEAPKPEPPKEVPKVDTPKKQKTTSKPWRPTLMPITSENLAKIAREPTQVAVDGRNLPSLVQVMSSGKRFHITLQDYNKMCIMRREKLQQVKDGETKAKRVSTDAETTLVTEIQASAVHGNGGTVKMNLDKGEAEKKSELSDLGHIGTNAATILKNVGLKNITIAPIPAKTATITSQTASPCTVSSPSLLMTTPMKLPQLGPAVSITTETILSPMSLPIVATSANALPSPIMMPKIPKSLTVIPQSVPAVITSVPAQAGQADAARP